ncbi:hypothetical protein GCM10023238_33300 [Streptomyces heliomycini]
MPASDVEAALREGAGELLESIRLFDVYENAEQLGEGRKSLAYALRFRASDRTLTVDEASAARESGGHPRGRPHRSGPEGLTPLQPVQPLQPVRRLRTKGSGAQPRDGTGREGAAGAKTPKPHSRREDDRTKNRPTGPIMPGTRGTGGAQHASRAPVPLTPPVTSLVRVTIHGDTSGSGHVADRIRPASRGRSALSGPIGGPSA